MMDNRSEDWGILSKFIVQSLLFHFWVSLSFTTPIHKSHNPHHMDTMEHPPRHEGTRGSYQLGFGAQVEVPPDSSGQCWPGDASKHKVTFACKAACSIHAKYCTIIYVTKDELLLVMSSSPKVISSKPEMLYDSMMLRFSRLFIIH